MERAATMLFGVGERHTSYTSPKDRRRPAWPSLCRLWPTFRDRHGVPARTTTDRRPPTEAPPQRHEPDRSLTRIARWPNQDEPLSSAHASGDASGEHAHRHRSFSQRARESGEGIRIGKAVSRVTEGHLDGGFVGDARHLSCATTYSTDSYAML